MTIQSLRTPLRYGYNLTEIMTHEGDTVCVDLWSPHGEVLGVYTTWPAAVSAIHRDIQPSIWRRMGRALRRYWMLGD